MKASKLMKMLQEYNQKQATHERLTRFLKNARASSQPAAINIQVTGIPDEYNEDILKNYFKFIEKLIKKLGAEIDACEIE